jgi:endonuclease/exonuclease/phosphatase family metal-dependent hydrolase
MRVRAPPTAYARAMRVRVVTYNVRGFRNGLERVANVAEHFQPDVLLLNESGGRLELGRFARRLGVHAARDPWSPFRRRVKNAVLVRPPWRVVRHRLHRFSVARRFYPRGALIAQLRRPGASMWVVAIHLGLAPAERRRQAQEVLELVDAIHGQVLVGGDLNEFPDGPASSILGRRLADVWLLGGDADGETYPADAATARIDYLFVSKGVRVQRAVVPAGPDARAASDHRPVVAELTLEDAG